jgi:hypothetical protein
MKSLPAIALSFPVLAAAILAVQSSPHQNPEGIPVLDLVTEAQPAEAGYFHGIPGSSGGGASGGWKPGPDDTVQYSLPLTIRITRATTNTEGNFVFEVLLQNTGTVPFDLPGSSKLTTVEKPGNKSRCLFFFQLQPLNGSKPLILALGSATTAGSASVPGSFIRIDPGKSVKVLLLGSSSAIKRSFDKESKKLAVKAICNEWRLDDNRFFLRGISNDLDSVNAIRFCEEWGPNITR